MPSSNKRDSKRLKLASRGANTSAKAAASAPSTNTQRAINSLLAVQPLPPGQLPLEAVATLRQLLGRQDFITANYRRGCCFDIVNVPALWSANRPCLRCTALNQLVQAARADVSSAVASALFEACFYGTHCVNISIDRDTNHGHILLPRLPLDLLERIVDIAIDDMKSTRRGSTVAALMHVSSSLRFRVAKAFNPIKLYQIQAPQAPQIYVPEEFQSIIAPTIRWSLHDVSFQRDSAEPPCPWQLLSSKKARFVTGLAVRSVEVTVRFSSDAIPHMADRGIELAKQTQTYREHEDLTFQHIGQLFLTTVKGFKEDPYEDDAFFPPRVLNLHQRALVHGSLRNPLTQVIIDITMKLKHWSSDAESKWCEWRWKFASKSKRT